MAEIGRSPILYPMAPESEQPPDPPIPGLRTPQLTGLSARAAGRREAQPTPAGSGRRRLLAGAQGVLDGQWQPGLPRLGWPGAVQGPHGTAAALPEAAERTGARSSRSAARALPAGRGCQAHACVARPLSPHPGQSHPPWERPASPGPLLTLTPGLAAESWEGRMRWTPCPNGAAKS